MRASAAVNAEMTKLQVTDSRRMAAKIFEYFSVERSSLEVAFRLRSVV